MRIRVLFLSVKAVLLLNIPSITSRPAHVTSVEPSYYKNSERVEVYQAVQTWMDNLFSSWKFSGHSHHSDPIDTGEEHAQNSDVMAKDIEGHWGIIAEAQEPSATWHAEVPVVSIRRKKILPSAISENLAQYSEFEFLHAITATSSPTATL